MSKTISISSPEQLGTIFRSTPIVVVNVFSESSELSGLLSTVYEDLSNALSRAGKISFVKIDHDKNGELVKSHGVNKAPCFLIFRDGRLKDKAYGSNKLGLQNFAKGIADEAESLESSASSATASGWRGAEPPRGYTDITDQVDSRNCEVLNADEEAGKVHVLFDTAKPSALDKGKSTAGAGKDWVQSGSDDQLLLYIPFQATTKLHTIQLTSLPSAEDKGEVSRPRAIHLFTNRSQNMDFGEADDAVPIQVIDLGPGDWNKDGTASVSLRFVKFQNISSVIVYVQAGDEEARTVRLDRVRLIGEAGAKREMGTLQKIGEDE
ncbi:Thioredoxin [Cordyceps fumosorosea ARSEF 2679]|uniref:Thioredoxin n=1 Tax=Cordyceps fumosorosea (strain ARSEF 2679) TaxID=1081104 RepID=A0A168DZ51_CORFA|nr:Thioredoxin [Cordyceps fumosorosea ARSEF 2679]OAA73176.1 Thioredoxin [Cordyceps fumosorosea ARSEF 2679]